jgi:hypothetical protein
MNGSLTREEMYFRGLQRTRAVNRRVSLQEFSASAPTAPALARVLRRRLRVARARSLADISRRAYLEVLR